MREAVADRKDVVVYFEVPSGNFILRKQACWEFIFQHCSYFTERSLVTLFAECGFEARDVQGRFGGQFLAIEPRAVSGDAAAKKIPGRTRGDSSFM